MKRVTARDVAELVGCSVASVSLVVNGRAEGRVNETLRARILAAVDELHYRPNGAARDLALRTPTTVAMLCPDVFNPFFGEVYKGAMAAFGAQLGVDLRSGERGDEYGPATVEQVQSGNLAGLVLVSPSTEVLAAFRPSCPTVLVDSPAETTGLVCIELDLPGASRQVAEHLAALGHRRVAYLGIDRTKPTFTTRRDSLGAALAQHGAAIVSEVTAASMSIEAGVEAVRRTAEAWRADGVTCVVCADDVLAFGVIAGARELGIAVPGELSVASYNDIPFSGLIDPPLTSVAFDAGHLGRLAGQKLLAGIRGEHADSAVVATHLEVRASTGPAAPPTS